MRHRLSSLLIAATFLVAGQSEGWAQAMRAGQSPNGLPKLAPQDMGAVPMAMPVTAAERPSTSLDPNRRLQHGDQLSFKIEQDKDPAIPLVVGPSGEVVVEPLERPIKISGMTTSQAAAEIKRALEKDYYYEATVRLTLDRANFTATMGQVYIYGEVARIGAIPVYQERPMKLSEAVLQAGGFGRYADDRKVKVTRMGKDGTPQTATYDMKEVLKYGKIDLDPVVRDGDRVFVPTQFFQK